MHGGDSGSKVNGAEYTTNWPGRNNLRPTFGCLRASNADSVRIANFIENYRAYRNSFQYTIDKMFYESIGRTTNSQDLVHVK
jgi:hypothetical protein